MNHDGPRILLALPFLTIGGAEALTSRLCRHLKHAGFRIYIVTTVPTMDSQGDATSWFAPFAEQIHDLPKWIAPSEWAEYLCNLIGRESIDLLWLVGAGFVYTVLPELRRRHPHLAVVDLLFNPVGHTRAFLEQQAFIDHVVTEHDGMKAWLVDNGVHPRSISVIPNGVDVDEFAPGGPKRDWRTGESAPPWGGPFVAAFLGRLSEEKAPDVFLEIAAAMREYPSIEFLVCGVGVMQEGLEKEVAARGLSDRVHFLGFVESRQILACCDAVIVCSRLDGRPNVVMESLAMGVPVVASRVGSIPDMLPTAYHSMLCDPGDVPAFVRVIQGLAEDAVVRHAYSRAGRLHAMRAFSLRDSAERYANLFYAAISNRQQQREQHVAPSPEAGQTAEVAEHGAMSAVRTAIMILAPTRLRSTCANAYLLWKLRRNGCDPAVEVDPGYYLAMYGDVARSGISPFLHYIFCGFREGRNPSARFDTRAYLQRANLASSTVNPLLHFLTSRLQEHASHRRQGCV